MTHWYCYCCTKLIRRPGRFCKLCRARGRGFVQRLCCRKQVTCTICGLQFTIYKYAPPTRHGHFCGEHTYQELPGQSKNAQCARCKRRSSSTASYQHGGLCRTCRPPPMTRKELWARHRSRVLERLRIKRRLQGSKPWQSCHGIFASGYKGGRILQCSFTGCEAVFWRSPSEQHSEVFCKQHKHGLPGAPRICVTCGSATSTVKARRCRRCYLARRLELSVNNPCGHPGKLCRGMCQACYSRKRRKSLRNQKGDDHAIRSSDVGSEQAARPLREAS